MLDIPVGRLPAAFAVLGETGPAQMSSYIFTV